LIDYKPTEQELAKQKREVDEWKKQIIKSRDHELEP